LNAGFAISIFYVAMSGILLLIVLVGFEPTLYFRSLFTVASILVTLEPTGAEPLSRSELERLMEHDDG